MSFMGSSVTAGHDTPFNISFSELTGQYMKTPLQAFNIQTISRNVALGNNPCVPYDLCVETFAGSDADIIHWEQTFNCGGGDHNRRNVYEPFIRMSTKIASHPILVFSDSVTPNWGDDQCKTATATAGSSGDLTSPALISKKFPPSVEDDKLLSLLHTSPREIPHQLNLHAINQHWNAFTDLINQYRGTGIQMWNHHHYEKYKCYGPYIPKWGCCSASWHPSILGHELRAAHYSYFWLLILKDAVLFLIDQLENKNQEIGTLLDLMNRHIKAENKFIPPASLYPTPYSENLRCYTTFQPRTEDKYSLEQLQIVASAASGQAATRKPFELKIFEDFVDPNIAKKAKERGYRDFKYVLYGNHENTLHLKINVKTSASSFVCQPPGAWGKLPDGFKNLWECETEIYLTKGISTSASASAGATDFVFVKEQAMRVKYVQKYPEDSQSWLCVEIEEPLPVGDAVLTILPTTKNNIAIAYVLVP
jgi:hypothetical protein